MARARIARGCTSRRRWCCSGRFRRGATAESGDAAAGAHAGDAEPDAEYEAEEREWPRRARRSRGWIAALGFVALVIGVVSFWLLRGWPAFSFRSRDSVLIADFENQTGDPRFDNALGTAFAVSIEQSRYANVFPRTRLDAVLARMEKPPGERITPALGREICQRENVRGLIAASITRTGRNTR